MMIVKEFEENPCKNICSELKQCEIDDSLLQRCYEYLKSRKFAILCSSAPLNIDGRDIKDYCNVWYSDKFFKWTSEDIYFIETNKKYFTNEFIDYIKSGKIKAFQYEAI